MRPSWLLSPLIALLVVLAMAGSALAGRSDAAEAGAAGHDAPAGPKVVIIVGPTGSLTAGFLREAEAAARIARRHSQNVHTIYTPNATWAAVKPALQGADIVIYLGHGNGWPSPYRDSLYRPSQNGLGLNPIAGGNNHTHRYYGEKYLARDVRLAPGAIVLLHHLCYAAGNSEPGLPEGPHGAARQRVENYAAGWMDAGASAVVAEAYYGPAYYVRALFESRRSVEKIWRSSPTFNGNVEAWPSNRTEGATALIDPYVPGKRYGRSLVVRGGVAEADRSSTPGDPLDEPSEPEPEVVWQLPLAGATFGEPLISGPIVEGRTVELNLPVDLGHDGWLPEGLLIEASWLPVESDDEEASEVDVEPADDEQEASALDEEPITIVEPFVSEAGPAEATANESGLVASLETPPAAGLYELTLTITSADGELLTDLPDGLIVSAAVPVARPLSAAFGLPAEVEVVAGEPLPLPLVLSNTGNVEWQQQAEDLLDERGPDPFAVIPAEQATLVMQLSRVNTEGLLLDVDEPVRLTEVVVEPGTSLELELALLAPRFSGEYLLTFDVETPSHGLLSLNGNDQAAVLLHVAPAPAPLATPGSN